MIIGRRAFLATPSHEKQLRISARKSTINARFSDTLLKASPTAVPPGASVDPSPLHYRATPAFVHLKSLLASDPKHEIAVGMLAAIYAQIGLLDRAIEYFQQSLTINPQNVLARFQLGLTQLTAQRPQEALATWKPGLDQPGEFLAHFHSGLALLQLQKPAEARALFAHAARRMPKAHALYPQLQDLLSRLSH